MLIGATGVGILGNLQAMQTLAATLAGLGLNTSGVRDVSRAHHDGDPEKVALLGEALSRANWVTGLITAVLMAASCATLSLWTFGHDGYALDVACLGLAVVLSNVAAVQMAILQASGRIADLAWVQAAGAWGGTLAFTVCFSAFGVAGASPALVVCAALNLALAWWRARGLPRSRSPIAWTESLKIARDMLGLGMSFMVSALAGALVAYLIRVLVTRELGVEAAGFYTAAFALSAMFVGFVLSAMASDYFPRLAVVSHDRHAVNRLVNEQTEISLLLACPGIVLTMVAAPWVVEILYSKAFSPATDLLHWFVLGLLGRVVAWPLGFVLVAHGQGGWSLLSEAVFGALHLALVWIGIQYWGLMGVGIGFVALYLAYTASMYALCRHLTGFRWAMPTARLLVTSGVLVLACFGATTMLPEQLAVVAGLFIALISSWYSMRGLAFRVGISNSLVQKLSRTPVLCWLVPKSDRQVRGGQASVMGPPDSSLDLVAGTKVKP